MSYTITLGDVPYDALVQAAEFVRKKYKLDQPKIICEQFETEFNVILHSPDYTLNLQDDIEFCSEADYLMFLLRWA